METIEKSIIINAPAEKVFEYAVVRRTALPPTSVGILDLFGQLHVPPGRIDSSNCR